MKRHDGDRVRVPGWVFVAAVLIALVLLVALAVVGLVIWFLLPKKMVVDEAAERQAMSDLQPWADQLMSIEAPRGTAITGLDAGVLPCIYDDSTSSVDQPSVAVTWQKPSHKGPRSSGPTASDRVEFRLLADRFKELGWKVDDEEFVKGEDGGPDRMDAVLVRGSGRGALELDLTTEGSGFSAFVTMPNAPEACKVGLA
ncbi:hypothetical protein ACIO3S_11500 [Nocardioides sp. NPDC087217]|uniref:hypothetical protein n=1 Tax=Nocardioides sp. NPDC087217 TaxID=3364335 RepID=UPI003828EF36